jgi:leader peptidase (prepilin peptidase)/N-methyltransferase
MLSIVQTRHPEGEIMLESIMLIVFFALIGASLGSFLQVVAQRSISGTPWWGKARSVCPECGHTLSWKDLVPVFSWLLLKGRCRYCDFPIPLRHFGAEAAGAAMGGLLAWRWGLSLPLLYSMAASFGLFLNALTDLEEGYVFDIFPLIMGIIGLVFRLFSGWTAVFEGLLGAAAGFAVIACIILLSRGGMGWGDATLAAGAGMILGWKFSVLTLYLGFMTGGIFSLALLAARRLRRKDSIPLVPFFAVGGMLTLLFGSWILALFSSSPGHPWQ